VTLKRFAPATQEGSPMRVSHLLAVACAIAPATAYAQVKIDMTKVTCSQYLALPPDQAKLFSAWMSGWFNQKNGYAWIDLNAYAKNVANVKEWCATYPDQLVMNGLQRATSK
jgi:HdeA/HdeB family